MDDCGSLESLGSAHFLVRTDSPEQLLSRCIALILEETKCNKGQRFAYRYGEQIKVDEYRAGVRGIS